MGIKLIARNNSFPENILQKLNQLIQHKTIQEQAEQRLRRRTHEQLLPTAAHK
jgi:hypothetical protein